MTGSVTGNRLRIGEAEVAYTDSGGVGDVLLLMHGGGLADWMVPLADDPRFTNYRVLRMTRAGYATDEYPGELTVADHARHAVKVLEHLGVSSVHVVAHSAGAGIALQLAVDAPSAVRTLCLLEPPLVDALADPADLDQLHAAFGPVIGTAMAALERGQDAEAFDAFMQVTCGPAYRDVLDRTLGTATVTDAVQRSRYLFTDEFPAFARWQFDSAVEHPVLLVHGNDSPPPMHRLIAHLAKQLPDATVAGIDHVNHLLPLTAPAEIAELVIAFHQRRAREQ